MTGETPCLLLKIMLHSARLETYEKPSRFDNLVAQLAEKFCGNV